MKYIDIDFTLEDIANMFETMRNALGPEEFSDWADSFWTMLSGQGGIL